MDNILENWIYYVLGLIKLYFLVKTVNSAYKQNRNVFGWFIFALISAIISYIVIKNLKKLKYDPRFGQSIIPPEKIERTYSTKNGMYVLGDKKVVLNGGMIENGKHKLGFLLKVSVKNGEISAISMF
jgi:hypothetical protein